MRKNVQHILTFVIFFMLSNSFFYSQERYEEVEAQISNILKQQSGFDDLVYAIKADEESFNPGDFLDPDNLLKDCYVFSTYPAPIDEGDIVWKGFLGIFKENNIIWRTERFLNKATTQTDEFVAVKDLNQDGKIEIIISYPQSMSYYTTEIWILSWDGSNGEFANYYTEDGHSKIHIVNSSLRIVDIDGDGVYELKGQDIDLDETVKIYSWSGEKIDDFGVPVPTILPRDKTNVEVTAKVNKEGDFYSYNYSVENLASSIQSIEKFAIDCDIDTVSNAVKKPKGWYFIDRDERDILFWFCDITVVSDNYYDYLIHPGSIENNFEVRGRFLPTIAKFYVLGNNGRMSTNLDEIFTNTKQGLTIGPTNFPVQLNTLGFLEEIITYIYQAFDLNWIDNQGIVNSLDQKLENTKAQIEKGKTNIAVNQLNAFINEVEAQRNKHLTEEAYALLKYNVEYLVWQLEK